MISCKFKTFVLLSIINNKFNILNMIKNRKVTYYVFGMHCAACESIIDKRLSKLDGITESNASLKNNSVDIFYKKGKKPKKEYLNNLFIDLDYTFDENPKANNASNKKVNYMQILTIFLVLGVLYVIINDSNVLSSFAVDEKSSVFAFFLLGVVASLSSCAALVGGILLSLSSKWKQEYKNEGLMKKSAPFVLFNAGRILSFAILGGFLGVLGSFFQLSVGQSAIFIIAVSIFMGITGLQMMGFKWARKIYIGLPKSLSKHISNEENFQKKYTPFIAGFLTFFLPCGYTLMAQSIALTTGSFFLGMVIMLAFAIGTLPMLSAISFSSIKFSQGSSFAKTFTILIGIFLIIFSIYNINSQLNILGLTSFSDFIQREEVDSTHELGVKIIEENGKQVQIVTMEAKGFDYYPSKLTLKANILTKLTVHNTDVVGCAQAMFLNGLYDDVVYLNTPKSEIEFIPKKGNYKISCTMGMVLPVMVEVL